jgi:hypothetical protein
VGVSLLLSVGLSLASVMGIMALAQLLWLGWACRRHQAVVTDAIALCGRWAGRLGGRSRN